MTNARTKGRALILSALMVLSVVAGTVAFSGAAAAAGDGLAFDQATVEQGETVSFTVYDTAADGETNGDSITVYYDFDGSGTIEDDEQVTVSEADDADSTADTPLEGDLPVPDDAETGTVSVNAVQGTEATGSDVTADLTVEESQGPSVRKVTHYDTNPDDGVQSPILEIAMTESINADTLTGTNNVVLYDDDDDELARLDLEDATVDNGRIVIDAPALLMDVDNVDIPGTIEDDAGNQLSDSGAVNEDVTVAGQTIDATTGRFDDDVTEVTDVSYRGTKIALQVGENNDLEIDGPGGYTLTRSSGVNSPVYVWNTRNIDFGDYDVDTLEDGVRDANISVRDLGLEVNLDEDSFNDEEEITGNVTANDVDRPILIELRDSGGDTEEEIGAVIDADGEAEFEFDAQDTGNYTVRATDNASGITASSDDFDVTAAADDDVEFAQNTFTVQRGDIANITVELSGTDEATIAIGTVEDDNYQANVTVIDDDDDGEVTLQFNTYTAGSDESEAGWSVSDIVTTADDDDEIESFDQYPGTGDNAGTTDIGLLDPTDGGYQLSAVANMEADEDPVEDSDGVGTLYIEERETGDAVSWTASGDDYDVGDFNTVAEIQEAVEDDTLTQDSTIAHEDIYVHAANVGGLSGVLEYYDDDDGDALVEAIEDGALQLTVEETGDLANVEAPDYSDELLEQNFDAVYADTEEGGTLYFIVDMPDEDVIEEDTELEANMSVTGARILDKNIDGDPASVNEIGDVDEEDYENASTTFTLVERDLTWAQDPYNVSAAADQTIEGSTTVAPGTEFTIRAQSSGDTQPRFIYTNESVVVQPDGTFSVTFDFSNQSAGDTFTVSTQAGVLGDQEIDGNVVEAVETTTETTETETTTETTTEETTQQQTPGFGVAIAVVALLAAALLAVRRD